MNLARRGQLEIMAEVTRWELPQGSKVSYGQVVCTLLSKAKLWLGDHPYRLQDIPLTIRKAIDTALATASVYPPTIYVVQDHCSMYLPVMFKDELYVVGIFSDLDDPTNIRSVRRIPVGKWLSSKNNNRNDKEHTIGIDRPDLSMWPDLELEVLRQAKSKLVRNRVMMCGDLDTSYRAEEALKKIISKMEGGLHGINPISRSILIEVPSSEELEMVMRLNVGYYVNPETLHIYLNRVSMEYHDDNIGSWVPWFGQEEFDSKEKHKSHTTHTEVQNNVEHPQHYGGSDNPYEAIKVIEAWLDPEASYGFCVGNALKYICRAGHKDGNSLEQDLEKAVWYLNRARQEYRSRKG